MNGPTWGVTATFREPLEVVERWVTHYLQLGAAELLIYQDEPAPEQVAYFADRPQVRFLPSQHRDDGVYRATLVDKQEHNLAHAFAAASQVEWLAHLDADEYLFPARRPRSLGRMLAETAPEVLQVRINPAEALFEPGQSTHEPFSQEVFRVPIRSDDTDHPLLADPLLHRGMSGHVVGKSFTRVQGAPKLVGIHKSALGPEQSRTISRRNWLLLHYDAICEPAWIAKYDGRSPAAISPTLSPHRIAQLEAFQAADPEQRSALFARLHVVRGGESLLRWSDDRRYVTPVED